MIVSVPPSFTGPVLQSFGFCSHSAKPGELSGPLSSPPPLVPQALRAITETVAIATSPRSLVVRVRISPPVSYRKPVMETVRAHDRWTAADRLRCSA